MTAFIPILGVLLGESDYLNVANVKDVNLKGGVLTLHLFNSEQYKVEDPEPAERILRRVGELSGLSQQEIDAQCREVAKGGKDSEQLSSPTPSPIKLESFVITPETVRRGDRATGTITLSANPDVSLIVLLSVPHDIRLLLQFDPPVEHTPSGAITGLQFPPGIRSLQFRFRAPSAAGGVFGHPLPILWTFRASNVQGFASY